MDYPQTSQLNSWRPQIFIQEDQMQVKFKGQIPTIRYREASIFKAESVHMLASLQQPSWRDDSANRVLSKSKNRCFQIHLWPQTLRNRQRVIILTRFGSITFSPITSSSQMLPPQTTAGLANSKRTKSSNHSAKITWQSPRSTKKKLGLSKKNNCRRLWRNFLRHKWAREVTSQAEAGRKELQVKSIWKIMLSRLSWWAHKLLPKTTTISTNLREAFDARVKWAASKIISNRCSKSKIENYKFKH